MKKIIVGIFLLASVMNADLIRVQAGAGIWAPTPTGDAQYGGSKAFDLEKDYGIDGSVTSGYMWIFVKHPVPVLPNVRIERTSFATDGKAKQTINFNGTPYNATSKTELVLNQLDGILYYNILDNTFWTTIDLGINLKMIDGGLTLKAAGQKEEASVNVTVPMAYVRGRVQVPGTGLAFEADTKYVAYDGSTFSDSRAKIDWDFFSIPFLSVALEAGYRAQKLKVDTSSIDLKSDIDISGAFLGINAKF
ncbi:MAG: TIGR04219 family outer membrane beta-barrel protein [Campylobacterales bacterium]|nr:TIGR04219 family outer membrane beta-barrel protein [Campylobacterales bacterium]